MNKESTISVVIPNYNREQDILELLRSVNEQEFSNFEVIVVDDNSSDGSVSTIRKHFPETHVIALPENKGPAFARNAGIKKASGDIVVGIDSDVIFPDKDTLTRIASKFSASPDISCLAFRILNYHTRNDDTDRWWHPLPIEHYADKEFFTEYFSGTGYAFQRAVFHKAGYFSEDLFISGEENDLALRILDSGFDIVYCSGITVLHKVSEQSRVSSMKTYYLRRNQIWIALKFYSLYRGLIFIVPRLVKTFFHSLIHGYFFTYCKSLYDSMQYWPTMLRRRKPLSENTWKRIDLIRSGKYYRSSSTFRQC